MTRLRCLFRVPHWMLCLLPLFSGALQADERTEGDGNAPPARPNVLLILADDMGIGDVGCYNPDSRIPTPILDRLAAEGVRYVDAHSPAAVCSPSRYGLLTGRYSFRSRMKRGVLWGDDRLLIEPGRETLASMLKKHGYRTAMIGKWHLGLGSFDPAQPGRKTDFSKPFDAGPHTVGFDHVFGVPSALDVPPYVYIEGDHVVQAATKITPGSARRWAGGGGFWRAGPIAPDFSHEEVMPELTRRAVELLRAFADEGKDDPFFLFFSLTAPHTPWVPTKENIGKSKAGYYGDFVAQVDQSVGLLLATLERTGMAEETLVLFTSDNGAHWRQQDVAEYGHDSHLGYRGMKGDIWEGGHRIPLISRWPGRIAPNEIRAALVGLNDLYATLAELVGHPIAEGEAEDSVSFLSTLTGNDARERTDLVLHSYDGMFALRLGDWKLIAGLGSGGFTPPVWVQPEREGPYGQLYDLGTDRGERENLYLERPQLVSRMFSLLVKRVKQN
ncbi:MAG: arylsulfatase [Planctomycetota bacterium]